MKTIDFNALGDRELEQLQSLELFFNKIRAHVDFHVFEKKEHLVGIDDQLDRLYFVLSGKAKISLTHEDGKRSIVHFAGPGEFIGELTLIEVERDPKEVTCLTPCVCMTLEMEMARKLILKDPDFMLKLSQYIGRKLLFRTWTLAKQQNYELRYRLAAYILMTECDGIYDERHTETAEYLGVSYRHLLQTMQDFREHGLIEKRKHGFEINRKALAELAKYIE